jgi:predicted permease
MPAPKGYDQRDRRTFGNTTLVEERWDMRGWTPWEIFNQDIRYALRTLRKSPGFAATAILTLALGIGASTAVFTVVDSLVLEPLAYRDSGNLVVAWERVRFLSADPTGPNPRHVDIWQRRATAFSGLTLLRHSTNGLALGTEHPNLVGTVTCLPNLFDILQVPPFLGRSFLPQDGVKGHDNVAILSYPLWQSLFHGDPSVIGKAIRIADTPREVIGVLPASFHFPNANALRAFRSKQPASNPPEPGVFLSVALALDQFSWNGEYGNWVALGRLKSRVTIGQAEAQLTSIEAQIVQEMPANERDDRSGALSTFVEPMQEAVVGDSRAGLWLLMAAVTGLMLIACLNLANAQLGRALSRRSDAGLRLALGITKWRLLWGVLSENLVLAVAGGATGVMLAATGLDVFRHYSPIDLPRASEIHLNTTVLLFSAGLALASTLLSGMMPVVRLLYTDPQTSLQHGTSRTIGSTQSHRLRTWLIGLQVFGCTALLLVTGLFSKSLLYLLHQDKGFETGEVTIAEVRPSPVTYRADQSRTALDDGVLQNLRGIPAVQAAGLVSAMPLEGESWIEGLRRVDRPKQEASLINLRWVSPGYFETMRERLVAGRFFEERDRNLNGVVLSEGEAQALWGSQNPIGGQVTTEGRTFTVIGVVADSRNTSLKSAPARMAYLHYNDRPPYATFFLVRAAQPANTVVSSMREAIWKYAPAVTIARVKTLDSQLTDSLATERFRTLVLVAFGAGALLLAMLGIYGVLSYAVVTRRQEIGVRIALGATRNSIYALTFGEAAAPVLAGLVTGLAASVLAGRIIGNLLYGTQGVDPSVLLIVISVFLASAATAAFLPARRAASVDPLESLRCE